MNGPLSNKTIIWVHFVFPLIASLGALYVVSRLFSGSPLLFVILVPIYIRFFSHITLNKISLAKNHLMIIKTLVSALIITWYYLIFRGFHSPTISFLWAIGILGACIGSEYGVEYIKKTSFAKLLKVRKQ